MIEFRAVTFSGLCAHVEISGSMSLELQLDKSDELSQTGQNAPVWSFCSFVGLLWPCLKNTLLLQHVYSCDLGIGGLGFCKGCFDLF